MRGRLGAFDESSSIIGNYELFSNLMKNSNHKLYVPGHGKSGNKEAVVGLYHKYLKTLVEEGKKAYEDDKETYEVKDEVKKRLDFMKDWDGFDRNMPNHLSKVMIDWSERDL